MEKLGDRELTIIGIGAFLAVLCLLFKWPFTARVVVALLILIGTTIFALTRIGEDKYKIEEWLSYRLDNKIKPLKYTFKNDEQWSKKAPGEPVSAAPVYPPPPVVSAQESPISAAIMQAPLSPVDEPAFAAVSATPRRIPVRAGVTIAWEEIGIYRLVTIWLLVVGFYFIYWLYQGGTEEIGRLMKTLFGIP